MNCKTLQYTAKNKNKIEQMAQQVICLHCGKKGHICCRKPLHNVEFFTIPQIKEEINAPTLPTFASDPLLADIIDEFDISPPKTQPINLLYDKDGEKINTPLIEYLKKNYF